MESDWIERAPMVAILDLLLLLSTVCCCCRFCLGHFGVSFPNNPPCCHAHGRKSQSLLLSLHLSLILIAHLASTRPSRGLTTVSLRSHWVSLTRLIGSDSRAGPSWLRCEIKAIEDLELRENRSATQFNPIQSNWHWPDFCLFTPPANPKGAFFSRTPMERIQLELSSRALVDYRSRHLHACQPKFEPKILFRTGTHWIVYSSTEPSWKKS